jgi:hypothetical protein
METMANADWEARVLAQIQQVLSTIQGQPAKALQSITDHLLIYHRAVLRDWLMRTHGGVVQGGPFAGLQCLLQPARHFQPPMLLGSYESELHDVIADIARRPYEKVLNIGCGEGYYAVGLARLLPGAQVHAFDVDPVCQKVCVNVAQANGCADRVVVSGGCTLAELERLAANNTLVVCDCEGAELELLDPQQVPQLSRCDFLIECHEFLNPAITPVLTERFHKTHHVKYIPNTWVNPNAIAALQPLRPVQRFVAVWEGRPGLTPWLVLTTKSA